MFDFKKLITFKEEKDKKNASNNVQEPAVSWIKCNGCSALMYYKEVETQNYVCPKCNYHMRMPAQKRLELIADQGSFTEYDNHLIANDPLQFVDKMSYQKRLENGYEKLGKKSSAISGECTINGVATQLVVFDFSFMGGSLGSVEGEKIARAIHRGIERKQGVVIINTSGGARMQESTFSLLQMSKTSAALKKLDEAGLPYISVLTDPTMGGVSASFAMLGDVIMAEPGALIGFAGQRVIEQTIKSSLPEGFQRAEFLLEKGSIDMIVNRSDMKQTLSDLLTVFLNNDNEEQMLANNRALQEAEFLLQDELSDLETNE